MKSPGVDTQMKTETRVIRQARWEDCVPVVAIENVANPHHPWPRMWFERELTREYSRFLVSEQGKAGIVGYCLWWQTPLAAEITNIATHPDYRRQGIASELIQRVVASSLRMGSPHLDLETRRDNVTALALYRRLGFDEVGLRPRYYRDGTDAVLMRLMLNSQ